MRIFAHGGNFSWQAQGKPRARDRSCFLLQNAVFVAGAALWTCFGDRRGARDFWTCGSFADFVAGTALSDPPVQISWQVQDFVNLEVQIS